MLRFVFFVLILTQYILATDSKSSSTETNTAPPFEYIIINGSAVLLSGILLEQIAFVSEKWLFFASVPLILTGLGLLVVDYSKRNSTGFKFLRGLTAKPRAKRPWLKLENVVAWPEEIAHVDE